MRAIDPSESDSPNPSKPVSDRKRAANRANAARSTGPRTDEGKAVSRFNAVRHGMAAQAALLPDEDAEALDDLAREVESSLRPRDGIEREFVRRVVSILWRLRRIAGAEEALFASAQRGRIGHHRRREEFGLTQFSPNRPDELTTGEFLVGEFNARGTSALERAGVYEQRLDRALHATLRQLQQLRKLREDDEDPNPVDHATDPRASEARSVKPPMASAEGAEDRGPTPEPAPSPSVSPVPAPSDPPARMPSAALHCVIVQNEPTAPPIPGLADAPGGAPAVPSAPAQPSEGSAGG